MASFNEQKSAAPQREEAPSRSKYGGISPKKPLISKDHERAYFDSADWVLGKQGASSSNGATVPAAEPLKPKLQGFLNCSFKSKALTGASVFSVSEADGVPPAPPAKAGVHVGVAGAAAVSSRRASAASQLARDAQADRAVPTTRSNTFRVVDGLLGSRRENLG
ncbi:hypothetical protein C2845_PM07G07880 [Panicum miliaceum]|uniref:Uncharacterized protein n=1 Tax=Panicum miliaceum TaxID=4540 RepID=A0A3L6SQ13_PANMI|nr:hypothetical protein C2845_PM07G07880 [Panicum miliaceum]